MELVAAARDRVRVDVVTVVAGEVADHAVGEARQVREQVLGVADAVVGVADLFDRQVAEAARSLHGHARQDRRQVRFDAARTAVHTGPPGIAVEHAVDLVVRDGVAAGEGGQLIAGDDRALRVAGDGHVAGGAFAVEGLHRRVERGDALGHGVVQRLGVAGVGGDGRRVVDFGERNTFGERSVAAVVDRGIAIEVTPDLEDHRVRAVGPGLRLWGGRHGVRCEPQDGQRDKYRE
ncbi:hypothetical protein OG319_27380 [Streptomyces tubercidicus]